MHKSLGKKKDKKGQIDRMKSLSNIQTKEKEEIWRNVR